MNLAQLKSQFNLKEQSLISQNNTPSLERFPQDNHLIKSGVCKVNEYSSPISSNYKKLHIYDRPFTKYNANEFSPNSVTIDYSPCTAKSYILQPRPPTARRGSFVNSRETIKNKKSGFYQNAISFRKTRPPSANSSLLQLNDYQMSSSRDCYGNICGEINYPSNKLHNSKQSIISNYEQSNNLSKYSNEGESNRNEYIKPQLSDNKKKLRKKLK